MNNKIKTLMISIALILTLVSMASSTSADTECYFFTEHDTLEEWDSNPDYMNDTDIYTQARTSDSSDSQLLTENEYTSSHPMGDIERAYMQAMAYASHSSCGLKLTPIYDGSNEGNTRTWSGDFPTLNGVWSPEYVLNHPGHYPWQWADTGNVDIRVEPVLGSASQIVYVSEVRVCVEYD